MTKFQEAIALYTTFMSDKLNRTDIDESVLVALAEMLGPNIYDADASLVACSDKNELKRVKELFLIKELKLTDAPNLDAAIKVVCGKMGTTNRKKYRVVFYYLLLEEFNSTHLFATKKAAKVAEKTVAPKVTAKVAETPVVAKETAKVTGTAAPKVTTTVTKTTMSPKPAKTVTVTIENEPVAAETSKLVVTESMPFTEKVDAYKTLIVSHLNFPDMDYDLLAELTNTVGEASTIDIKSSSERHNIKENFLKGRLGVYDADLDDAIEVVNTRMGSTPKYRPVFYYLLTKHLGREWVITQASEAVMF